MEQSPSWEAANRSTGQEILQLLWKRRFVIVFTRARDWTLSWARL